MIILGTVLCHLGLASVPHETHSFRLGSMTVASLRWITLSPSSSTSSDLTVTAAGDTLELLVVNPEVEPRWARPAFVIWVGPLVEELMMAALRTVPVRERSACLYVRANCCSALREDSLIISCIGWITFLMVWSGQYITAERLPLSLPSVIVLTTSLRDPFTGVTSKPNK